MNLRTKVARLKALRQDEDGAEAVEFGIIGPLLFFVVIGILYTLLLFAAQLSVAHSTAVGARYAAIYDKGLGRYPTSADITSKVLNKTALFKSGACTTPVQPAELGLTPRCR